MNKILKVKCPQCDTVFPYYESESRPFCCERCKMIDLGHWFEESYKVPDKDTNGKRANEESEIENENDNENSYDDYTNIDKDTHDENDY